MKIKKPGKTGGRYIPLDDIKKLNDDFLSEMETVKRRLGYLRDPVAIKTFHDTLLNAYTAAIEIKTREREVDYEIKLAEIAALRNELKPWRRGWLWRLIFQPLTNRAQDIIEERAELDADIIHTSAEKAIETERKRFDGGNVEKLSKRELKRLMRERLKKAIEKADEATVAEALAEPPAPPSDVRQTQENAVTAAPMGERVNVQEPQHDNGQLPGQMRLDEVQAIPTGVRRARPPRSCRKPR